MSPRQPFLSALDYIFYIKLHIERERDEYSDGEERLSSSFRGYNTEIPKLEEILKKLVDDLHSAFDAFLNEFLENDGIYCLLSLLRMCLNRQQSPSTHRSNGSDASNQKNKFFVNKERHQHLKRALRALNKIVSNKYFHCIASCVVSNLTRSRIIALQLLTKACNQPNGVNKVLEAMTTIRIIFGESVRFKFLVSMINSGNHSSSHGIECNALSLLNTLLSKTSNYSERIRLQCEIEEEAGFDVDYLEKVLIEQNFSKDELIWSEIKKYRKQYINVNEILKNKRQFVEEKDELKEEVEMLQRSLNKLEEDKINLMTIERELKEKCEDLELEVDHLKTKFNVLMPVHKKVLQRPASDQGTGDSGQWSDSDVEAIGAKNKLKATKKLEEKSETKTVYNYDQNMRCEEEFIYVPAIHPPPDFSKHTEEENQMNGLKNKMTNNSKRNIRTANKESNDSSDSSGTRWRIRQRSSSNERTVVDKPLVVDVMPKQKCSKSAEIYSESTVGMDRENSELILDWNYEMDSRNERKRANKESEAYASKYPEHTNKSISMNQINNIKANFECKQESVIANKYSELFSSGHQNSDNFSFVTHFKPLSKTLKQNLSQSNGSLNSTRNQKKNLRSSLQSYFFSGSSTFKPNKNDLQSIEDSKKSFPIPKTYKKNFILKGHGNCGLYSGNRSKHNNLSDDLKSDQHFDNISALVHKEITEAARDIGAWL